MEEIKLSNIAVNPHNKPEDILVGVYTSPRKTPTLSLCLQSLNNAGLKNITVFYDNQQVADTGYRACQSNFQKYAFPSFCTSLFTLLLNSGRTYESSFKNCAYLMVQDDVLFSSQNVYEFLLNSLYPCIEDEFGFMSLFCAYWYKQQNIDKDKFAWINDKPAILEYRDLDNWVWSAQALLFSQKSARDFLTSPLPHSALGWYYDCGNGKGNCHGLHKIDFVCGQWAKKAGRRIYQPNFSFCNHIGQDSTIFKSQSCYGERGAYRPC
ncbi:MAG: hypothetical protein K2X29_05460 [Candidatus Obscuribacterales bacterium]|nr:hypothetical protein [Candidatus Obscuribacterales bacterium]